MGRLWRTACRRAPMFCSEGCNPPLLVSRLSPGLDLVLPGQKFARRRQAQNVAASRNQAGGAVSGKSNDQRPRAEPEKQRTKINNKINCLRPREQPGKDGGNWKLCSNFNVDARMSEATHGTGLWATQPNHRVSSRPSAQRESRDPYPPVLMANTPSHIRTTRGIWIPDRLA